MVIATPRRASGPIGAWLPGVAVLLVVAATIAATLAMIAPPAPRPADAPAGEFSAERALAVLRTIAQQPHPIGSPQHAVVQQALLDQLRQADVTPQIQQTVSVNTVDGMPLSAGSVSNILARIPGSASTKAVLLMAHYDSVPTGPGASDDGAAVAALVETARALAGGAPLKNDVIVLLTDGEEFGLLGATAFVEQHPWARDVGLVLNFEARGVTGASVMFETSFGNAALIREFAQSAPQPLANSLTKAVYDLLPNGTDFTVFREAGYAGLNFAYIGGVTYYHTPLDDIAHLDRRSLQHHGSYALALARHFGNLELPLPQEADAIYFDLLGRVVIAYPLAWASPLTALAGLLLLALIWLGLRRRALQIRAIAAGWAAMLLALIAGPLAATLVWQLIRIIQPGYTWLTSGDSYNSLVYGLAFTALTLALTIAILGWIGRRVSLPNVMIGVLLWWLIALVILTVIVPGASYLLLWPLLLAALGWSIALYRWRGRLSPGRYAALAACALPGVVLIVPVAYLIFITLTVSLAGAAMGLLVLLAGLLVPLARALPPARPRLWSGAPALLSAGLLALGSATAGFDAERPQPVSLIYGLDADRGQAIWASTDTYANDWSAQYLSGTPEHGTLATFLPYEPLDEVPVLWHAAPAAPLRAPELELVSATTHDGVRTLKLRATSQRGAPSLSVYMVSGPQVRRAEINGRSVESGDQDQPWGVEYYAVPEAGLELTLELAGTGTVQFRVVDFSDGLPALDGAPPPRRPAAMMPSAFGLSDTVMVSRTFTY